MITIERDPFLNRSIEKLHSLDIQAVVFDLDDTLIYTGEIFTKYKLEFSEKVSQITGVDFDYILKRVREINDEEYFKMGVSPNRWITVADRLSQELNNESIKDHLDILMKIYTDEPRLRIGAKNILSCLKNNGFKTGMVTHASVDWTERKLNQTGLFSFFDAIEVVDPKGQKTAEHWQNGFDLLNTCSKNCLVVGDNLKGDIIPSISLGTKAIWMPSPWSVYREGVIPEGIVQMTELHEFWDAVQKLT